jgi:hypothetical protein
MASLKSRFGCWLHERWKAEMILLAPSLSRRPGLFWLDLCNRQERLKIDPETAGRVCQWQDSSRLTLAAVFPGVAARLLRHVLQEHEIQFADVPPPAAARPKVSFLLPVGGEDRVEQFKTCLRSVLGQTGVEVEAIVVEYGASPLYRSHVPAGVNYLSIEPSEPRDQYNKSIAMNAGFRQCEGEIVVILDADMLIPARTAARLHELFERTELDACRFGRFIFELDQETSQAVQARQSVRHVERVMSIVQNTPNPMAVRRDAYWAIGGHDERFFGWGGEDIEFLTRLRTRRVSDGGFLPIVHLWHPTAPKKSTGHRNQNLVDELFAIPPEDRIARLTHSRSERMRSEAVSARSDEAFKS